jgi:hypothetical protein
MKVDQSTKGKRIAVTGKVQPATDGQVSVQLMRKKGKKFVQVKTTEAELAAGEFSAQFKDPKRAKKCEVIATYSGDASNEPSHAKVGFKC